jgi:hypothetical protein
LISNVLASTLLKEKNTQQNFSATITTRLALKVLWTSYQHQHITTRHNVTKAEFEQAWKDRDQRPAVRDSQNGEYFVEFGFTDADRCLTLVWRWQNQDPKQQEIWPITAYGPDEEDTWE